MRRLYDKDERLNHEGVDVLEELSVMLEESLTSLVDYGYSIRELAGLMHGIVCDVECKLMLRKKDD